MTEVSSTNNNEHFTLRELALWLRVSERHIQRLLAAGEGPPSVRIGRRIIFSRAAVRRWLEASANDIANATEPKSTASRRAGGAS
jgi:excisionase family DNA binding protein